MGEVYEETALTPELARRLRRLMWHCGLVLAHIVVVVALCSAADRIEDRGLHAALLMSAAFTYAMTLRTAVQGAEAYREGQ